MGNGNTKEAFQERIRQLTTKKLGVVISQSPGFWCELCKDGVSFIEVCAALRSADVQTMSRRFPGNLRALVVACLTFLEYAAANGQASSVTGNMPAGLSPETCNNYVSTSLFILTRLLSVFFSFQRTPVMLHDRSVVLVSFSDAFFWGLIGTEQQQKEEAPTDTAAEAGGSSPPRRAAERSLGERALDAATKLFLARQLDTALRTTILRFFLVGLSEHLHRESTANASELSLPLAGVSPKLCLWYDYLASTRFSSSSQVFDALIVLLTKFDPTGWGIPYNHLFWGNSAENLMNSALQLLVLLLNQQHTTTLSRSAQLALNRAHEAINQARDAPEAKEGGEEEGEQTGEQAARAPPAAEEHDETDHDSSGGGNNLFEHAAHNDGIQTTNNYLRLVRELQDEALFAGLLRAFVRLLNQPRMAQRTYLPGSIRSINSVEELLMLFWILTQESTAFVSYTIRSDDLEGILHPLLFLFLDVRNDSSYAGLIHISTFILLILSSERDLGIRLNLPFAEPLSLPGLPSFYGNWSDFLILALLKHVRDPNSKLKNLHECLLTIIANVSPYMRNLSVLSSRKLLQLFDHFARPRFLLGDRRNHLFLFILLELFENIVQYQYDGNPALIYEIITRQDKFDALANLSFDSALQTLGIQPPSSSSSSSSNDQASSSSSSSASSSETTTTDSADQQLPSETAQSSSSSSQTDQQPSESATSSSSSDGMNSSPLSGGLASMLSSSGSFIRSEKRPVRQTDRGWFEEWKQKLPLTTLMRLIAVLQPKVLEFCKTVDDEKRIVEFIRRTTLVGLLPVPHAILIRRYQSNRTAMTSLWFTPFIWNVILRRNSALFFSEKLSATDQPKELVAGA